jgi:hypothetical protein
MTTTSSPEIYYERLSALSKRFPNPIRWGNDPKGSCINM